MTETPEPAGRTDRLELLADLRDRLFAAMDRARPSSLAGLSKEARAVLAEIDKLTPSAKLNPLDELVERRRHRLSAEAT